MIDVNEFTPDKMRALADPVDEIAPQMEQVLNAIKNEASNGKHSLRIVPCGAKSRQEVVELSMKVAWRLQDMGYKVDSRLRFGLEVEW